MKPKRDSEYIKIEGDDSKPLDRLLNKTGYDFEDLFALTGISRIRLTQINNGQFPTDHEISLIAFALKTPETEIVSTLNP